MQKEIKEIPFVSFEDYLLSKEEKQQNCPFTFFDYLEHIKRCNNTKELDFFVTKNDYLDHIKTYYSSKCNVDNIKDLHTKYCKPHKSSKFIDIPIKIISNDIKDVIEDSNKSENMKYLTLENHAKSLGYSHFTDYLFKRYPIFGQKIINDIVNDKF